MILEGMFNVSYETIDPEDFNRSNSLDFYKELTEKLRAAAAQAQRESRERYDIGLALSRQIDELVLAIRTYGEHLPDCELSIGKSYFCTCGYHKLCSYHKASDAGS